MRQLVLFFILSLIIGCSQTSSIVTGQAREPISADDVTIFVEEPNEYEVIGLVTGHSVTGWTQQQDIENAAEKLKEEAAKMGANGVILMNSSGPDNQFGTVASSSGEVATFSSGYSSESKLEGKAVWVSKSNDSNN